MKSFAKKAAVALMVLAMLVPTVGLKASSDDHFRSNRFHFEDHGRGRGRDDHGRHFVHKQKKFNKKFFHGFSGRFKHHEVHRSFGHR